MSVNLKKGMLTPEKIHYLKIQISVDEHVAEIVAH
jgi:hypothetical protein